MSEKRRSQGLMVGAILGGAVVLVVLLILVRSKPSEQVRPSAAPLVRVERATPEEHRFVVHAHGTVSPRSESDVVPQVSGEVIWISRSLASGGFFEKGDPLLKIERSDYEVDLEAARAAVARAESEFGRAKTERERQRLLAGRSVASQSRIDDAENSYRVTEAVLREARARRARAERDLARTVIRAPYPGRVRNEDVDIGQFVQRGTPVATIYAVDYAEIRLPLPDRELAFLELPLVARPQGSGDEEPDGPPVTLRARFAGSEHVWHGTVVRTEGELDPQSRMVHVVARVADPYGGDASAPLAVGLFVEAEIAGRTVPGVYVLPRTAVRSGDRVYVIGPDDRLQFRAVRVLRTERDRVVIAEGLSPGDRVCISTLSAAIEGMTVRVADGEAALAEARP